MNTTTQHDIDMNPETIHLIASALNNATTAMTEMTRILASFAIADRSLETFPDRLKSQASTPDERVAAEPSHRPVDQVVEDQAAAAPVLTAEVAPAVEAAPGEAKPTRKRRTKAEIEAAAAVTEPGPAPVVDDHVAETFGPIEAQEAPVAEPVAATAPATEVADGEIQAACFAAAAVPTVGFRGIRDLLSRYGVTKVVELLPEQRMPFYVEVKALADAAPVTDLSGF